MYRVWSDSDRNSVMNAASGKSTGRRANASPSTRISCRMTRLHDRHQGGETVERAELSLNELNVERILDAEDDLGVRQRIPRRLCRPDDGFTLGDRAA